MQPLLVPVRQEGRETDRARLRAKILLQQQNRMEQNSTQLNSTQNNTAVAEATQTDGETETERESTFLNSRNNITSISNNC